MVDAALILSVGLRVNRDKTAVGYVCVKKFPGYSFYVNEGVCHLSVHSKSVTKMKLYLKTLTSRSNSWGHVFGQIL